MMKIYLRVQKKNYKNRNLLKEIFKNGKGCHFWMMFSINVNWS